MFTTSEWIWANSSPQPDEYSDFYTDFNYDNGNLALTISADSNYVIYLNGKIAGFGQYADYPWYKIYDEVDLTQYAVKGKNHLAVTVWYYGITTTSVYYKGNAALRFELYNNGSLISQSNHNTLCRKSVDYVSHKNKIITPQLGLSYFYDATLADGWLLGELVGFGNAYTVNQNLPTYKRPCKTLLLEEKVCASKIIHHSDSDVIYDLGTNKVGFLKIEAYSEVEQTILVAYGEHLNGEHVPQKIHNRDFSVEIKLNKGITVYLNPFRRLGCKYFEVFSEAPLDLKIGICPTTYPVNEVKRPVLSKSEAQIYDICVNTLRLCMHEHYEDCPWREQALYSMDSRNQMLLGYFAFKEYEFPRANLKLIANDKHPSGLLSICYPQSGTWAIPSFSLHYFTSCLEYYKYSGDKALLTEVYDKLCDILNVFIAKMKNFGDVILPFPEFWNFYEWRTGLSGDGDYDKALPDMPLNALLSIALRNMDTICTVLNKPSDYGKMAEKLNENINKTFFDSKKGLYFDQASTKRYSQLSNSLAVMCGAVNRQNLTAFCEKLINDKSLTPITLSMQTFLFDALLKCNTEKYSEYILSEIERKYRPMVENGTGTVWETELGQADFDNAGSLCHGWSAIPIYYYHILKK